MKSFHLHKIIASLLFTSTSNAQKTASDIPRANTPSPGPWPQQNVMGCGFPGLPITTTLSECTEPLDPLAPDMRGYWLTADGEIGEYIEMCGSRWIDVSKMVLHDFPVCTGVVGDGKGCQDYRYPIIANTWDKGSGGMCSPISAACKFETGTNGNCVNLYTKDQTTGDVVKVVSRCLQSDNKTMILIHPLAGTVVYTRVPPGEEPNCIVCEGGEHDGFETNDITTPMPCPYKERRWKRCGEDVKETNDAELRSLTRPTVLLSSFLNCFLLARHFVKSN